jgi:hypothetical protein
MRTSLRSSKSRGVLNEGATNSLCHQGRNGIAHLTYFRFQRSDELVPARKGLQASGLANADGSVLGLMAEPAIRVTDAPRRQAGGGAIPRKPTVHIRVAVELPMAIEEKRLRPPEAMPMILTTADEVEAWMTASLDETLKLQRPLPDGTLRIVARGRQGGSGWSGNVTDEAGDQAVTAGIARISEVCREPDI